MKSLKKNIVAGLGILAAVGCASVIISPWGHWIKLSPDTSGYWERAFMAEEGNRFGQSVLLYRRCGILPSNTPICGFGLTIEDIEAAVRERKAYDAQVIAEATRQEAQEAPLRRLL